MDVATRAKASLFTGHHVGLLIILAILASPTCGNMSEAAGNRKNSNTSAVARDAAKAAETWSDWAHDKLQKGMGWQHENAKMSTKNVQDIATKAKEKVSGYTSGAASHALEKATEAKDSKAASAEHAKASIKNKAFHAKDKIVNNCMAGEAQETLESRPDDAYAGAKKTSKRACDSAERSYDDAMHKASEAYESAKESTTTGAKRGYEAAKEKASKAAGDLGAEMKPEELRFCFI